MGDYFLKGGVEKKSAPVQTKINNKIMKKKKTKEGCVG